MAGASVLRGRASIHTEQVHETIRLDGLFQLVIIVRTLPDILFLLPLHSFEAHHEGSFARSGRSTHCIRALTVVIVELTGLNRGFKTLFVKVKVDGSLLY